MSNPPVSKLAASGHSSGRLGETLLPDKRIGRIELRFRSLAEAGELGLIAYITAGDPSLEASARIVVAAAEAGADIIELGVPFSDPVADGPVIQRASERALRSGTTLAGVLELVRNLRSHTDVPLVLFSYFNPILQMGLQKFAESAASAGADGVLTTDLTPEEADEYRATVQAQTLDTIFLAAPANCSSLHRFPLLSLAHRRNRRARGIARRSSCARASHSKLHSFADRRGIWYFSPQPCERAGRHRGRSRGWLRADG
jgi:Tryptophan synthase alpha chain